MELKTHRYQDEFDRSLEHNAVRLGHLMRQEMQACIADLNITPEQWQALIYLNSYDAEDGLTQNELAELTLKDKTTISRLVDNMERHELLTRTEGLDRRSYRLHLSGRGRQLVEEGRPLILQHFGGPVFEALDETERRELLRLIQKVRQSLRDS